MKPPNHILPTIVLSQFCCTSLWFAGNAVTPDLISTFGLTPNSIGHLISSVQFGFIIGTLVFAILALSDRFSPSKVFLTCALLGAISNLGIIWEGNNYASIITLRFLTGFFLAGIYPVGMKIAADYYHKGLGKSLGFLVGALVVGTAFPHLLKGVNQLFDWKQVILSTSFLAATGGISMILLVPNGPFRKKGKNIKPSAFLNVFKNKPFRAAAFGYFGHMWELYAFWAFIPVMLSTYQHFHPSVAFNISFDSFSIIAIGGIACVLSGFLSIRFGTQKIAFLSLLLSAVCCILSPLMFLIHSPTLFISFLLFWGMVVVADSPLFSTLIANNAKPELKGTALTIVNCIGFAITIISIQILNMLSVFGNSIYIYLILAIGPVFGLVALIRGKGAMSKIDSFQ